MYNACHAGMDEDVIGLMQKMSSSPGAVVDWNRTDDEPGDRAKSYGRTRIHSVNTVSKSSNICTDVINLFHNFIFPTYYSGLVTLPCHGLVDTRAQDGVIGLWHFQRWCA